MTNRASRYVYERAPTGYDATGREVLLTESGTPHVRGVVGARDLGQWGPRCSSLAGALTDGWPRDWMHGLSGLGGAVVPGAPEGPLDGTAARA